jgi:hypothetical protein
MMQRTVLLPESRGVLRVDGDDRCSFLQGLVSNDVTKVAAGRAVYAALLTPQGKFLHDFFIAEIGDALYLDCEAARRDDLRRRLSVYKLRAKVALSDATDAYAVALLFGPEAATACGLPGEPGRAAPWGGGTVYVDPRLGGLGARAILPRGQAEARLIEAGFAAGRLADYERLRLSLGVPDGSRDLPVEKAILLENGFDELNGIDWAKGCYMGQELTARTRYRGLVRKRLLPVAIDGPVPPPGTPVMLGDKEAGEMRSAVDGLGLALLRLDSLDAGPLTAGHSRLTPRRPDWARF